MKMHILNCPKCGGKLSFNGNRTLMFCAYCGTEIFLDDEVKRSEHTYTYRKIDEARIKEAEVEKDIHYMNLDYKEREQKRDNKLILIYFGIMIALFIFAMLMVFHYEKREEKLKAQGKIQAGNSSDYEGKKYKAVVSQFEAMGFTNIETIDLEDDIFLVRPNSTVKNVSIDGNNCFSVDDFWEPNAKVIITHH